VAENAVEVRGLKKRFDVTLGIVWRRTVGRVKAVEGVSFCHWQG
jgi:ABC-type oligopeptide transport system ATPase subunit